MTSDLSWLRSAIESQETYEELLESPEFPDILLTELHEIMKTPYDNAAQLQEVVNMIEFSIDSELPLEIVTTLHSTRDWAIQTLLDMQKLQVEKQSVEVLMESPIISESLQQMQSKLFTSAPCREVDIEMELHQSLLLAIQTEDDSTVVSDILEMCATNLHSDEQFVQFAETALCGKAESLTLGTAFLHRLYDRQPWKFHVENDQTVRRRLRLFDTLTLRSKVAVWANHLPSWRSQLQTWMLTAHRAPFQPIHDLVPPGWQDLSPDGVSVVAACRKHSHLYVTFIEWCRCNVDLMSSRRSMELVNLLSKSIGQDNAASLFRRQLLSQVPQIDGLSTPVSYDELETTFVLLGNTLDQLQNKRSASDIVWQYEWVGVLEQCHLLHEALELTFRGDTTSDMTTKINVNESAPQSCARFFSWFYSFHYSVSADEIAAQFMTMSTELQVPDIQAGALWLRQNRTDFNVLPIIRLRLVWFWLLKSIDVQLQMPISVVSKEHALKGVTTDVLESVEYIFRRFTPVRAKRPFQVELVTQLLAELEWRAKHCHVNTGDMFLDAIKPVIVWLTKIVHLMQLEEYNKDGLGYHANDVEHLARRLEPISR
ncbi:hypothetical protein PsorP6_018410 [Peronosclerospora sorghi]|nr:hypothetical protein PsorP6_018410 [Peronosclerospora sorghi]